MDDSDISKLSINTLFTRQEVIKLTGIDSNQLSYLDKENLVQPIRKNLGSTRKAVFYSWEQVLKLRAINDLRENVSLQTIRKIIEYLNEFKWTEFLNSPFVYDAKNEIVIDIKEDSNKKGEYWLSFTDISGKDRFPVRTNALVIIPPVQEIVNEVWEEYNKHKDVIDDFEQRALIKSNKNTEAA